MSSLPRAPVLISGAGPTGLMLALWLTRLGVKVRIVDKAAKPGTTSRALVVHARTLEFYRQLGMADEVTAAGIKFIAARLWVRGEVKGRAVLGEIGRDETPWPYILVLGQDRQEEMLAARLASLGVRVERETELVSFEDRGEGGVAAILRGPQGEERCDCDWLAGCDGAHSAVREGLGVGFPGGTYEHLFYVADVHGRGPAINGELNIALDRADFLAVFPMAGEGNARLVGTVDASAVAEGRTLAWQDVSKDILQHLRFEVDRVNWFSTYHVHHRVADRFRVGRAFLLGDAAHIHSPVGGQGMNTGMGDAVNLSWKLAMVVQGRAPESILDTYPVERMAFARRLVDTTDRAFTFVTRDGALARFVRLQLVPRIMPAAMANDMVRRFAFRTMSQIEIEYRSSALSIGRAGRIHAGDRLPWVPDDFAPLSSLEWQAHVHGPAPSGLAEACEALGFALHVFPWNDRAERAGFTRGALYFVRPDGYVGLVSERADAAQLEAYCAQQRIKSSRPAGVAGRA